MASQESINAIINRRQNPAGPSVFAETGPSISTPDLVSPPGQFGDLEKFFQEEADVAGKVGVIRQDRSTQEAIRNAVRDTIEFGGLAIGGIIGTASGLAKGGLPAVVEGPIGGALGLTGARQLATQVEEGFLNKFLGLPARPRTKEEAEAFRFGGVAPAERTTLTQQFQRIPGDLLEGFTAEVVGLIIPAGAKLGIDKISKSLGFGAEKFTPEAAKVLSVAQRLKETTGTEVKFTPAEIMKTRPLALFENVLARLWGSAGPIESARIKQLQDLSEIGNSMKLGAGPIEEIELLGGFIKARADELLKTAKGRQKSLIESIRTNAINRFGTRESLENIGSDTIALTKRMSQVERKVAQDLFIDVAEEIEPGVVVPATNLKAQAEKLIKELTGRLNSGTVTDRQAPAMRLELRRLKEFAGKDLDIEDIIVPERFGILATRRLVEVNDPVLQKQIFDDMKAAGELGRGTFKRDWAGRQAVRRDLNQLIRDESPKPFGATRGLAGKATPRGRRLELLKQANDIDMRGFAETSGGSVQVAFDRANLAWGSFKDLYDSPEMLRIVKTQPAELVDTLIRAPGKFGEWVKLEQSIGKEGMIPLKKAFIAKLIGFGDDFSGMQRRIAAFRPATLLKVMSETELASLRKIANKTLEIENIKLEDPLLGPLISVQPAKIFKALIGTGTRSTIRSVDAVNVQRLNVLKSKLSEKEFNLLQREMLAEIFQPARGVFPAGLEGNLRPSDILRKMEGFGPRTIDTLLPPEVVSNLRDISTVLQRTQGAEALAGNVSGTAQVVIAFAQLSAAVNEVFQETREGGEEGGLIGAIGGFLKGSSQAFLKFVLLPRLIAKAYLSDSARQIVMEGFRAGPKTQAFTKLAITLATVALDNPDLLEEFSLETATQKVFRKPDIDIQKLIEPAQPFRKSREPVFRQAPQRRRTLQEVAGQ